MKLIKKINKQMIQKMKIKNFKKLLINKILKQKN